VDAVPLDDRGLLLGDGLFETLLWNDGALILAEAHAARMAEGAGALGLPAPAHDAFLAAAEAAVRSAGLTGARAAVRITLTAGSGGRGLDRPGVLASRLFATAAPSVRPATPAQLHVAGVRRNQASPTSRMKTLAYLDNVLARREALAAGADEALMLNTLGDAACAAAANVFWLGDGALFTPAAETGRLDGIMARQVKRAALELGLEVVEGAFGVPALAAAEAVFLTSSLIGVRPARFGAAPTAGHPMVSRLAAAIAAFV
jgi:branched-chain amino acid aminotransferase/4-amino-4-deoxychorismate lyase